MAIIRPLRPLKGTTIRRERLLPLPGEVLVREGQEVAADTVVARTEELPGEPYIIDLRAELKAPKMTVEEVDRAVLKKVGQQVKAQEVIARHSHGFWGEVATCKSPVNGTVEFVSRSFARILLREDPRSAQPMAIVPVAKKLDVWPASLKTYMRFREGDEVRQGMILAASPSTAGLDYAYSPISGVIEKVCTKTGTVTIVRPVKVTAVDAYFAGRVESVIPERGAVIAATGTLIEGVFGVGFEHHGPLAVLTGSPEEDLDPATITDAHGGKVIVAGRRVTLEGLRRAVDVGACGAICGGVDHLDLVEWLGQEIEVGITGQEDVDFTLILTEGFGALPMDEPVFATLLAADGRVASVNGTTHVRAGVIRPEVVIVGQPGEAGDSGAFEGGAAEVGRIPREPTLIEGAVVRLVGTRRFGQRGQVVEGPAERPALGTEARVKVVRVRLEDGTVISVPQANIEVL
ncbi:MAG: hypothetical protein ACYC41_03910 [Bacillota bacterium]